MLALNDKCLSCCGGEAAASRSTGARVEWMPDGPTAFGVLPTSVPALRKNPRRIRVWDSVSRACALQTTACPRCAPAATIDRL